MKESSRQTAISALTILRGMFVDSILTVDLDSEAGKAEIRKGIEDVDLALADLAASDAEPQGEWLPLADGRYDLNTPEPSHLIVENHGEHGYHRTEQVFPGWDEVSTFYWTENIRLCQRVAAVRSPGLETNENGLLPCPFCGNSEYVEFLRFTNGLVCVHCDNCGASGYASDVQEWAREAWNTRQRPAPPAGVRFSAPGP